MNWPIQNLVNKLPARMGEREEATGEFDDSEPVETSVCDWELRLGLLLNLWIHVCSSNDALVH